ncbi:MAG: ABC transporter ATP-binding protein [Candidatus Stahlbacteria bacterium]|nr:ABC transporter ATP-binding protein [Candidatus Stahlbacteria bacterium]
MIQIINISKSFNGHKVLDKVNLEVKEGATTVIIGSSGCGKTVLLKHIIGLIRPDEGEVIVDGLKVSNLYGAELFKFRERIAIVFQGSALLDSLTVADNITLGLREHTKLSKAELSKIVDEKLALVKMEGTQNLMPSSLSGGMKKRVAIARALAMNPEYILYDEPTTGLDPITADKIDELICDLKKTLSITMMIVTHDLISAYRIADKIAMLAGGKIIFEGTSSEVKHCKSEEVRKFVYGRGGML